MRGPKSEAEEGVRSSVSKIEDLGCSSSASNIQVGHFHQTVESKNRRYYERVESEGAGSDRCPWIAGLRLQ